MIKYLLALLLLSTGLAFGQVESPIWVPGAPPGGIGAACTAPTIGYLNLTTGISATCKGGLWTAGSSASGTVTSVVIAGTTGQITVAGTCTITSTGTCTLSIPPAFVLPGTINGLTITTTTGTLTLANSSILQTTGVFTMNLTCGAACTPTFPSGSHSIAPLDSPSFTTPVLGVATATSLAIGGATCGSNVFCATGAANISGAVTLGSLTNGRITFSGASGLLGDSATLLYDGTTLQVKNNSGIFKITNTSEGTTPLQVDVNNVAIGLGVASTGSNNITLGPGVRNFTVDSTSVKIGTSIPLGWVASGTSQSGTLDAALSRISAGVIGIGTGAAGSMAGSLSFLNGTLGGTLGITGAVTHSSTTLLSGALTYGGVTLSNSVTGTGSMVLSTSPTITNPIIANITPGANHTWTQNGIFSMTSLESGAVANTLYLSTGLVGIKTVPTQSIDVLGPNGDPGASGTTQFGVVRIEATATNALDIGLSGNSPFYAWIQTNNIASLVTHYPLALNPLGGCVMIAMTSCGTSGIFNSTGRVYMASLTTSAGLQTGVMCIGAASEVIQDSVACLASGERYKENIKPLDPQAALDFVLHSRPSEFTYRPEFNGAFQSNPNYNGKQVGFIADWIQPLKPELVVVSTHANMFMGKQYPAGTVEGFRYENMTAMLSAAIIAQQEKINLLTTQVSALQARIQ